MDGTAPSACRTGISIGWHDQYMDIEQWWPKLQPATRDWLVGNNGDVVPAGLAVEITAAGGSFQDSSPSGSLFPDDTVDWIEAVANGEEPEAR